MKPLFESGYDTPSPNLIGTECLLRLGWVGVVVNWPRVASVLDSEFPALIYAESSMPSPPTQNRIEYKPEDLLSNAFSGVLIVSIDEPEAWSLALAWASKMHEQNVYMKAAILCVQDIQTALAHPLTQQLKRHLDTVILQPDYKSVIQPPGFHPAMQSARLFLMEPGLICHDISDIRRVLGGGGTAIATSSRVLPSMLGGSPAEAVDECIAQLAGRQPLGIFARLNDGGNLSSSDFDAITERLSERIGDDVEMGIVVGIESSLPEGEPGLLHAIWALSENS